MDGRSNPAGVAREKEVALMRRILLVLAVGAIMVLSSVSYAFAYANPDNEGNGSSAPGQSNAEANCANNVEKQGGKGPTNCNHSDDGIPPIE
jgi:hypothetical protein